MMNRLVSVALCGVLLALTLCGSGIVSARADVVDFMLYANDAKVGETTTVSVSIPADSYFTNATMHLHYDSTALSFINEDVGEASARGAMFMVNDKPEENMVSAAYVTVKGIQKAGVLVTFTFEVIKETPVEFRLSFNECVGVDANDVEFDVNYKTQNWTINKGSAPITTTTVKPVNTTTAATTKATSGDTQASSSDATTPTMAPSVGDESTVASTTSTTLSGEAHLAGDSASDRQPVPSFVTDAQGSTVTNADGTAVTTMVYMDVAPNNETDMTWLYIVLACVGAAAVFAVVVFVIIKSKKNRDSSET